MQVLRSLAFELKKDDTVKKFIDLYNECVKSAEFNTHILDENVHLSKDDKILLRTINEALSSGLNPDWNETNASSISYIENKPEALPANGGNADTVGGLTVEELLNDRCFYDYIVEGDISIEDIINCLNKEKGYSVFIRPGSYKVDELVIKASNIVISGIGQISKLLGVSIKIIGNNNIIEGITIENSGDGIENKTAIYVEGNENTIRKNYIVNYNNGIIVEGSNNTIMDNKFANIIDTAIQLTANNNANYGNNVRLNTIKNSNKGIILLSTDKSLTKNYVCSNSIYTCAIGIDLSNTMNDSLKTTLNIINENIVMRGRGESSEYLSNHQTIISEFSSKNIISSNITSGKEIVAPNNILNNNIF